MLAAATQRLSHSPAPEMFDALLAEVRAFSANGEFDDDVCLVGMECVGNRPILQPGT
jgi:serine phosphatase RsbU (regulator of sigma subunit)